MAKPKTIVLPKKEQEKALSLFKGSKTRKAMRSARTIAGELKVNRYQVMALLEKNKLAKYSVGSYE